MTATTAHTLVIIPCAAAKVDGAATARELYSSANFAHVLRSAEAHAASTAAELGVTTEVVILSARYGLVSLDQSLASYDVKMGDAGCITAAGLAEQVADLAPAVIESLLPAAYRDALAAAVAELNDDDANEWISFLDVYEAAPGIGFQRGVASSLARSAA